MDLTEAEDIKKKWQEYTEELYQKKKKRPWHQVDRKINKISIKNV